MKNKIIKLLLAVGTIICTMSMFVTAYADKFICFGRYYQPEMPEGIDDFKARHMAR